VNALVIAWLGWRVAKQAGVVDDIVPASEAAVAR